MSVQELFNAVDSPDEAAASRVLEVLRTSVRGRGLGRLAELGAWVAGCQGSEVPRPFARPRALVFASNHGVAARGVSAHRVESVRVQMEEIATGAGPAHIAARAVGCGVRVIDEWAQAPTGDIAVEDAMSDEAYAAALTRGCELADQEVDYGTDLIVPGDIGVGSTTISAAVIGTFTRNEPVAVIGRGSGISDEVWKVKVEAIRDAMFRVRSFRHDVPKVLAALSSPDFVACAALIAQSAARRTPVLIDGPYTAAAAYVAERLAPGTRRWLAAAQLSGEPTHATCLAALGLNPILSLDTAMGQGAAALLAVPVVNAAAAMVGDEVEASRA